jgi:hypothetical protein
MVQSFLHFPFGDQSFKQAGWGEILTWSPGMLLTAMLTTRSSPHQEKLTQVVIH